MPKSTDIILREVTTSTLRYNYRTPMKFGGRVVTDVVLLNVEAKVETRDGRQGIGAGSMPLGNAWAWPSSSLTGDQTLAAMQALGEWYAKLAEDYEEYGHPLEITHDLAAAYQSIAEVIQAEHKLSEPPPKLAQLVSASPLEAALHDAYGRALGASSYHLLGAEFANRDLSRYLTSEFAGEYLDQYTLREPQPAMPLYHLVGALDPLTEAEIETPLADGLPETLGQWIAADGLTHLKIKLAGDDLAWDISRVVGVEKASAAAQAAQGQKTWWYSLDFNEKCPNVEYVIEFLNKLQEQSPRAFKRVQYIEQPTNRDLKANPENKMHEAAKIKPVVIDESLVDFESLQLARQQGYSGVALKACKGHTEALLMGAAAQKYGMFLCVQDLTCVGASFLHSASLAAHIPTVAAIEGNGRQYCPAGNDQWSDRFPGMFQVNSGCVATSELGGVGLGY